MVITLDPSEALMAAYVGCQRRIASLRRGCQDRHGYNGQNAWETDIIGALAEVAVAKALDLHWSGSVNAWKRADLGRSYQVRVTTHSNGQLIVREGDPEEDIYILVVQVGPLRFKIAGQMGGRQARRAEWLKRLDPDRPRCWAVPQAALEGLETREDVRVAPVERKCDGVNPAPVLSSSDVLLSTSPAYQRNGTVSCLDRK